jgi:hypothetical protein
MNGRRWDALSAFVGLGLLAFSISRIGWDAVVRAFQQAAIAIVVIALLSLLRMFVQTVSWTIALRAEGLAPPIGELLLIRLASQGVGYLSVLGPVASEPMKISLHRQYGNWPVIVGIALIVGSILSIVVIALQRKTATNRERPHEYAGRMNQLMDADSSNLISRVVRQIHIFVKKGVMVHYLVIFTVLGTLPVFLSLAALGSNLTWTLALYFNRRFFRRSSLTDAEQTQITD